MPTMKERICLLTGCQGVFYARFAGYCSQPCRTRAAALAQLHGGKRSSLPAQPKGSPPGGE